MGIAGAPGLHLVTALDLDRWGATMAARWEVARHVRSLILQSNDRATVDMPAGEGAEMPGYDGIVDCPEGSNFVPEGHSVWELGTNEDPGDKATSDYGKRTEAPLGEDKNATTFVICTPRIFKGKREWEAKRRAEGKWRDVRFLDAHDLETAFEQAPGAHFLISSLLGKPAFGVVGLEEWWGKFARVTNPPLTAELALAGREKQAQELLPLLAQDAGRITVSAASTDDVLAFVAASIESAQESDRETLYGRALVIREAHALQVLDRTAKLLILLPSDETLQREAMLVHAHNVVLFVPRPMPATIEVPNILANAFTERIKTSGMSPERASQLGLAAGRSIVAFQNLATVKAPVIRRAWLLGGWIDVRGGDLDVVGQALGQSFEASLEALREAVNAADPLFSVVGNTWSVASPEAGWDYIGPQVAITDLQALERAVQQVLGAVDPKLELPVEDRWQAAVYGKSRAHSNNLRTGIATTLAVLGAFGKGVDLGSGLTAATWTEIVVRRLFKRANDDISGDLWASLTDVLRLLAEAAPDVFLRAVHKGLEGDDPVLVRLFTDTGDTFTTSSPHTGLLWALEVAAWSPEHFALAMDALARLTEVDPGGKLGNRPSASFASVVRPWMPQTAATPEARIRMMEAVAERHRRVAWRLITSLLPEFHGVGHFTSRPRFRRWARESDDVSMNEYWVVVEAAIKLAADVALATPDHWPQLIEYLPQLPPGKRSELLDRLRAVADER
jgi:hypothetical protein